MMKSQHVRILFVLFLMLLFRTINTGAYYSYGARATGMGGAFTGMGGDASIFYWNPGGLALLPGWVIEMQYGKDAIFADGSRSTMESMKGWHDQGDPAIESLNRGMTKLAEKDWLLRGGATISFIVANPRLAMFFNQNQIYYVQHDDTGTDLETDPTGRDENGDWRYALTGIQIREYGVTIPLLGGSESFTLSVSGKYIDAIVYRSTPDFQTISSADPDNLFDRLEAGDSVNVSEWGLDAGMIILFGTNRLGFSARNLRKYDIDIDDTTRIRIKPEYRAGYSYQPTERFRFSLDYSLGKEFDLLGNSLDGSELTTGFEGVFGEKKWLILRGGVSMPLAGDAPMLVSLGSGLAFDSGVLDVGYAFDMDRDSSKLWLGLRFVF
ncbi:conjugal transfer protein TraF [bacterium]|nr:conjugal transfer protein TraF [candidate division CSSED10-310 bacterium]